MTNKFRLNTRFENGGFDAEPWFMAITEQRTSGHRHRPTPFRSGAKQYAPSHCDWLVQIDTDNTMSETMKLWLTDKISRKLTDAAVTELWERPVPAAAGDELYQTFDE